MKTLLVIILVSSASAFAQTGLIAHKSHSGTALTYAFADPGNFGAPPAQLVSIKWLNDSTIVKKMDRWGGSREDTIYNHPIYSDPNIPIDSIRKMSSNWNGDEVEFIDTNKRLKSANTEKPASGKSKTVQPKDKGTVKPAPKMTEDEPSKRKKSALWFFIISGGTFTGMMLLTRRKKQVAVR